MRRLAHGPEELGFLVLRDISNEPMVGVRVTLDFTACCDISLCGAVVNGQTVDCANVDCANGTVEGITDA